MTSKRRKEYTPISKYPVYNREFDRLRMASQILNAESIPNVHSIFYDRLNIEALLRQIVGDKDGLYKKENQPHIAYIPFIKKRYNEIEAEFVLRQKLRVNSGYEKLAVMPEDLQEAKFKTEAQEDILLEEKELLEQRLKTFVDIIQKTSDDSVLANGLRCSGSFHGIGTSYYHPEIARAEIDGQMISQLDDGTLYIDDNRSKYDGMSLPDYRKLAKQWVYDRMKADADLLLRMQAEAKEKGEPIPRSTGRFFSSQVSKSELPPFPKEFINHKAVKVEKEKIPIKRNHRINISSS